MEPDFSGYATKAGLKCSDGRTIMAEAFKHCDGMTVPLVWQHGHSDSKNILGHAVLEARSDGVYAYGFFNETDSGKNAKTLVEHNDINAMSIYANQLVEKAKQVFHGMIREVSLVLSGANPGALIDYVSIAHSDGGQEILEDEAVIYTGLTLEHAMRTRTTKETHNTIAMEDGAVIETRTNTNESTVVYEDGKVGPNAVAYSELGHAKEKTIQDVYDSLTTEQQDVVAFMIGEALSSAKSATHSESDDENTDEGNLDHTEGTIMGRNVFENAKAAATAASTNENKYELSHEDVKGIVADAVKLGSLRDAVDQFAVKHGIDDIDLLFPDAKLLTNTPEFDKRRTEWVAGVLGSTRHTPFSRVKTVVANLSLEEARAKGYVKGTMKKDEWFGLTKRTTSPTTVYKKQRLDRDDVVDITDFDVVAWLKGELRLMLEEEIARAILISDGRDVSSEDKIKDPIGASDGVGIRSILNDHELFVTTINVNVDDTNSTYDEVVDAVMDGMEFYKGTGTPTLYTTIRTINMFLKAKDSLGRRLYANKTDVAAALGVASIVAVDVMNDEPDLLGIIVNLADYNVGADKGGEISLFEDFDIDYNQQKYLLETRMSGALTKIKSALVVRKTAASAVLTVPTAPTFDEATSTISIPTDTHVVYKIGAATQSQGTDVVITETTTVTATPAAGYFLSTNTVSWVFTVRD